MLETSITAAIIVGAAAWFVLWLKGTARGERGCSCGKCPKNCPTDAASSGCMKSGPIK